VDARAVIGGPFTPVPGPARMLTPGEYEQRLEGIGRRAAMKRRWSLVLLIVAAGAIASFTAVTYRLAPLYYEAVRFNGSPLPAFGFGWVWWIYLASLWVLGLGHKWFGLLSLRKSLATLGGLTVLGGACYAVFGLVVSVWGLLA